MKCEICGIEVPREKIALCVLINVWQLEKDYLK